MYRLSESEIAKKIITKLVSEKQEIKINPIERFNMNDNLRTKEFLTELFDFIERLKVIFGDGFQWSDSFAIAGLTPSIIGLLMKINEVKSEAPELSKEQIKDLTKEFSARGLSIFWTDNNEENEKYGIQNLAILINELTELIDISIKASKDGIKIDDIQYLPSVISSVVDIITASNKAFIEAKHLSAIKVSELLVLMLGKIFFLVK